MVLTTENLPCKFFVRVFFIVIFQSFDRKLLGTCELNKSQSDLCHNYSITPSLNNSNASPSVDMIWMNSSSSDCNDDAFKPNGRISPEYPKMYFTSYLYKDGSYRIPTFNVSFTDIKWKRLFMRYQEHNKSQPSLCRRFDNVQNLPSNFTFFFDCLWDSTGIDGKIFNFQYKVIMPNDETYFYRHVFTAPQNERIDETFTSVRKWQLFMLVDVTEIPRNLCVRVQTAPQHFNVSSYVVTLFREMGDNSSCNNSWAVKVWDESPSNNEKFINLCRETDSKPGSYYFEAKIKFQNGSYGFIAKSPCISVVDLPEQVMLISVVSVVILVPILLAVYFMWRRKCYNKVETPESVGPPKMLLMYNPVSIQHVRVMTEITRYLRSCRLLAMLDQFDIPQTEHKDPAQWYREAFDEADFVGIFASPKTTTAEKEAVLKYTRYLHTEAIAMSQLRTKLVLPGARCKFFCIALPGTNWDTLPPEAQALKRYILPRDLDPLLVLVGLAPQCDHGAGFEKALEAARAPETPITICVPQLPNHDTQPAPPTPPTTPHESRRPNHHPQHQNSNDSSCCLDEAFSLSDQDLVSSSQPYLSDTGSRTSSLDQLSLLGE